MEPQVTIPKPWDIELINAYADDLPLDVPLLDAVEIAKERDREAAQELILSIELLEFAES